jgi:hypothetical protein
MTIRQAMETLNGETQESWPQPRHMEGMRDRLAKLKREREAYAKDRMLCCLVPQMDQDITSQKWAIEKALRIRPDLVGCLLS